MTTIQKHQAEIDSKNYTGVVTRLNNAYLQFGEVRGEEHDLIALTVKSFKKAVELVSHPQYAYSRQKNGYVNIYVRDQNSPTGVSLAGGISDDLDFLLDALGRTGQLSPTEDLRTAK